MEDVILRQDVLPSLQLAPSINVQVYSSLDLVHVVFHFDPVVPLKNPDTPLPTSISF